MDKRIIKKLSAAVTLLSLPLVSRVLLQLRNPVTFTHGASALNVVLFFGFRRFLCVFLQFFSRTLMYAPVFIYLVFLWATFVWRIVSCGMHPVWPGTLRVYPFVAIAKKVPPQKEWASSLTNRQRSPRAWSSSYSLDCNPTSIQYRRRACPKLSVLFCEGQTAISASGPET